MRRKRREQLDVFTPHAARGLEVEFAAHCGLIRTQSPDFESGILQLLLAFDGDLFFEVKDITTCHELHHPFRASVNRLGKRPAIDGTNKKAIDSNKPPRAYARGIPGFKLTAG